MAAIITEDFRRNNARMVLDSLRDSDTSYYIGISQQDEWHGDSAPYPKGTVGDVKRIKDGLTGLFRVQSGNTSIVVPKILMEPAREYKVFDPFDPACFYADADTGAQPCYAMTLPNTIYLCIHKTSQASTLSENDIENTFGVAAPGAGDYGIFEVQGYTWAYIGRYDEYALVNNSNFVSIGYPVSFNLSQNTEVNTFAKGVFDPLGSNNTLIFTAVTAGSAGNDLRVTVSENGVLAADDFHVDYNTAGGTQNYNITYGTGSTAAGLDNFINSIWPVDYVSDPNIDGPPAFTSQSSGDISGVVNDTGTIVFSGGNSSTTKIKDVSGGLIHGFFVEHGGQGYTINGVNDGSSYTETLVDATVYGTDEYGNPKSEAITVDITYTAGATIPEQKITKIDLSSSYLPNQSLKLLGWRDARIEIDWSGITGASTPTENFSVIPHVAPIDGFGRRKDLQLPAWYAGLYTDTGVATVTPSGTTYHQFSVIKNPTNAGANVLTENYVQPLNYFEMGAAGDDWSDTGSENITQGWQILQNGEKVGVVSHVQTIESDDSLIALDPIRYYYTSDYKYGFRPIQQTDPTTTVGNIEFVSPDGLTTLDTLREPENLVLSDYRPQSGEVIFEDNRGTITREEGQNEELKVIIQL